MEVKRTKTTLPLGGLALVFTAPSFTRNVLHQQLHIAGDLGDGARLGEDREGNPRDPMTRLNDARGCRTGNKSQKRKREKVNNTFQFKTVCKALFCR